VQVDPIKPTLKPTGTERLKVKCDILLSTSAFKLNLRRYIQAFEDCGEVLGRGLHSSTSQLNLSRFWSLKPQQASTFQLNLSRFWSLKSQQASTSQRNLRRFCKCDRGTWPTKSAHVKLKSGRKCAYVELKSEQV